MFVYTGRYFTSIDWNWRFVFPFFSRALCASRSPEPEILNSMQYIIYRMSKNQPIESARTSLTILESLVSLDGAGVSELASELDKPKSTIYDHLDTLEELGYIRSDSGTYHVTTRLLNIGERSRRSMPLYEQAKPEVDRLAEATGEHASLVIQEADRGVLLHTARGDQAVNVNTYAGMRIQLHTTAPGKAILAFLPRERVDEIVENRGLPALTGNTITSKERLYEDLDRTRERKYALDRGERIEGMHAVGAPILSRTEEVRGAISVYGPSNRLLESGFEDELPKQILRAANIVELNINYQ